MKNSLVRPLRILGIDPGLRVTGFGVLECAASGPKYLASGLIRVPVEEGLAVRIRYLHQNLCAVLQKYRPDQAVVEEVFVSVNARSSLLLGQARGALLCTLAAHDLPVSEYAALLIKQAVVGYGKATKQQMQFMTARILGLSGQVKTDAADALACALCHLRLSMPR